MQTRTSLPIGLLILSICCVSCSRSDEPVAATESGVNAQVLKALKPFQSGTQSRGRVATRPDGPLPNSAAEYINLSLQHYDDQQWEKCVEAGIGALHFDPASAIAYNNICSAYNQLGDFDRAILACNKALALKPDFPLAKGNLGVAIHEKANLN